ITRGEQLLLVLNFIIYFRLSFSKTYNSRFSSFFIPKATIVFAFFGLVTALNYISIYLPDTWRMLTEKFMFFVSSDLNHDQSSSVRTHEYIAIFNIENWVSSFYLIFGKGWLGTFSLPQEIVYNLTQADFSLSDIANNKFYSPHGFIGFHVLKFGLIGSFVVFYSLLSKVNFKNQHVNKINPLAILILPATLYIGYFSPIFAFFSSIILTTCKLYDAK
ncbi:hypothetical protein L4C36_23750, partial [Photobacterium japonica]|uniref:hypothetical protein n=1 Tax=Photobacterium japonica TaxID=2910235 RepID=UPI003D0FC57F